MNRNLSLLTESEPERGFARALREIERLSAALERSLTEQKSLQLLIRGFGTTLREHAEGPYPVPDPPSEVDDPLRESEARFRAATEGSLDAFIVLKTIRDDSGAVLDFEIADLNGKAARLIAKPREALISERISRVLPRSRTSPGVFERYRHVAETGMPLEEEISVDAPGVGARWLRHQVVPIPDGVAVTARDVTARRRVEIREKTQSGINCVLADAPSLEAAIPSLLQIVCENFGWDVGEIWAVASGGQLLRCAGTFQMASVATSAATAPRPRATYARGQGLPGRVWETGQPAWILDLDGDRTFTRAPVAAPASFSSAYAFPILAEGDTVGVMEFFSEEPKSPDEHLMRTMSELGLQIGQFLGRKLADKALHESEEKYRTLFDGSPLPIFLYDTLSLRILDVNAAALEHYGYSRAELLSMTIEDIQATGAAPVPRTPAAGGSIQRHRKKSGASMDAAVWPRELQVAGRSICALVVNDMTEQKRLENELRQSQKMEAIGRLAGGIAHDFNNLLTAILGYGELVAANLQEGTPDRSHLREVLKAGERAAALTQQLLTFSRKQVVVPRVLELNATVQEVEKMLRRIIGEDIELVTRLDPNGGNIKADPGQIEQVILNLAVNARDAMPRGGRLTIETKSIALGEPLPEPFACPSGGHVLLAVSDSGIGMDAETQSHIFEPFFTTKDRGKGTGLGLATVYGIVQQNEAHIWVDSETGKGTTFKIYFPRVEEAAERARPETLRDDADLTGWETVLLVEDEWAVRRLAEETLRNSGYMVLSASSAEEALALAREHVGQIHLVVTDVVMPGLDGRELVSRLSAARGEIRALYMSGYSDSVVSTRGVLETGVDLLQKPFSSSDLARRVRANLDGEGPLDDTWPAAARKPRSARRPRSAPLR